MSVVQTDFSTTNDRSVSIAPGTSSDSEKIINSFSEASSRGTLIFSNKFSNVREDDSEKSIKSQLQEKIIDLKLDTAQVAMYIDKNWRNELFKRIDSLFDSENWDEQDSLVDAASFATFLRMVIHEWPVKLPSLGASYGGHLLAAWVVNENKLTIEFFPNDEVRWTVIWSIKGKREKAAGITTSTRLSEVLSPYNASQWLRDGGAQSS